MSAYFPSIRSLEVPADIEKYSPLLTYDFHQKLEHYEEMSSVSKARAIAAICIGLISLCFLTLSGAAIVPFIASVVCFGYFKHLNFVYDQKADFNRQLIVHMNDLDEARVAQKIAQFRIVPAQIPFENLKGLVARYNLYESKRQFSGLEEQGAYAVEMAYLIKLMTNPHAPVMKFYCDLNYNFKSDTGEFIDNSSKRGLQFYRQFINEAVVLIGSRVIIERPGKIYNLNELSDKNPVDLAREIFDATSNFDMGWEMKAISWIKSFF